MNPAKAVKNVNRARLAKGGASTLVMSASRGPSIPARRASRGGTIAGMIVVANAATNPALRRRSRNAPTLPPRRRSRVVFSAG